jgi:phospholipase/carboxylesterase
MADLSPPLEIETAPHPEYAVIWLHGLGADGTDFAPIVPDLGLDGGPGVRFVFPHAPFMPVTCNGGYVMRAWYDILSLAPDSRRVDEDGIRQSRQMVRALIARENARGIPCRRIFLAGFSQGGAIAYTAALTHPEALAGAIALSTYLPSAHLLAEEATAANRATPILAAHGTEDDVVSLSLGTQARDFLTARGYDLEWHEFPMPHAICFEEIALIGAWLRAGLTGD